MLRSRITNGRFLKALAFALVLSVSCLGSLDVWAAEPNAPTTREIIDTLKMRGVVIEPPQSIDKKSKPAVDGKVVPRPDKGEVEPPTINVRVLFEFDSNKIASDAKVLLDNIGTAFVSEELAPYKFMIAGHTDAVGSDVYNLGLSTRRAEAVKAYLVDSFAIDPRRLVSMGYGESRLLMADHPANAVNRRVQITNLGTANN